MNRSHRTGLWQASALAIIVTLLAVLLSGLTFARSNVIELCAASILIVIALHLTPASFGSFSRTVVAAESVAFFSLIALVGVVASYLAILHSGPLMDETLATADSALGFDWITIRSLVERRPAVLSLLRAGHDIWSLMPFVTIATLCAIGATERCYRFVKVMGISIFITTVWLSSSPQRRPLRTTTTRRFQGMFLSYAAFGTALSRS